MGLSLSKIVRVMGEGVFDIVDVTDPNFRTYEVEAIREAGGDPIIMEQGERINTMITRLKERAAKQPIKLLRIHGHGLPGLQSISAGRGILNPMPSTVISAEGFESIRADLLPLRPYFSGIGEVYLMGCYVADGDKGKKLLQNLASVWRVPITGAVLEQFGCRVSTSSNKQECISHNLNHEGPTATARP